MCCVVPCCFFAVVLLSACAGLATTPEIRVDPVTLALLGFTIGIQLMAWMYCRQRTTNMHTCTHAKRRRANCTSAAASDPPSFARVVVALPGRVASRGGKNVLAAEAIADDHFNDVCCNCIGMASAVLAAYNGKLWFMDGVGGMLIAAYIFTRWAIVAHEQFVALLGATADRHFLSKLTYLAMIHDERITKVDTVSVRNCRASHQPTQQPSLRCCCPHRSPWFFAATHSPSCCSYLLRALFVAVVVFSIAYKIGTKYHCEVHVVLPGEMSLRVAHDIGESLEQSIEQIEDVELAWVHLDFEVKPLLISHRIASHRLASPLARERALMITLQSNAQRPPATAATRRRRVRSRALRSCSCRASFVRVVQWSHVGEHDRWNL